MTFKSEIKFNERELIKFLNWTQEFQEYSNGEANINDVVTKFKNKIRYVRANK